MKANLSQTTFIIPVFYDSQDRISNAAVTIAYLCRHLNTNIIIYEFGRKPITPTILADINTEGSNIEVLYESGMGIFRRTKYINAMLKKVQTPVVVNYDVDVILGSGDVYLNCQKKILEGVDMLYPYFQGSSQKRVDAIGRDFLFDTLDIAALPKEALSTDYSAYGHCQFFSTEAYRAGGGENELFVAWGPEDVERYYRFTKLGYRVEYGTDCIYHLEHSRGVNSSIQNPHLRQNRKLFEYIQSLSVEKLREYYGVKQAILP